MEAPLHVRQSWRAEDIATGKEPLWFRVMLWLFLTPFLLAAAAIGSCSIYHYSGYCWATGERLSRQEQIDHAVERLLMGRYPNLVYVYDAPPPDHFPAWLYVDGFTSSPFATLARGESLAPYQNMTAFYEANPDCCSFTLRPLFGVNADFDIVDSLLGEGAGYVNLRFRVQLRDANGTVHEKWAAGSFGQNNCGGSIVWR